VVRNEQFFVEPVGNAAHGNKAIADLLHTPEPDAMEGVYDRFGKPHPSWHVDEAEAEKFFRSSETLSAEFRFWKRLENSGAVYEVFFSKISGKFRSKRDDPLEGGRVFKHLEPRPVAPFRDEDIPF